MNRFFKVKPFVRKLLIATCAVGLFFCGLGFLVLKRLADVVAWGFARAVPGAVLELEGLRVVSLHHLAVDGLAIRDKKSGEELLKMKGGGTTFSFRSLLNLKITEVRLTQPALSISPHLLELFAAADGNSKKSAKKKSLPFGIARVICEEGSLRMYGWGEKVPELKAKFSFDLRDLTLGSFSKKNHHIILWAVVAQASSYQSPFLQLDRMELIFNTEDLSNSHLDRIRVQGGRLVVGKELRALVENSKEQTAATATMPGVSGQQQQQSSAALPGWKVDHMNILNVRIAVEEEDPRMAQLQFQMTTRLKNITLGDAASNLGSVLQTVQLSDIALPAPSGQKVVVLPNVFVRFTLQDLLQKQIEEVVVLYPKIYLNEDLFAYMESITHPPSLAPPQTGKSPSVTSSTITTAVAPSGWMIHKLRVDFGSLIIGANEESGVGLPIEFETYMHDIALENLAEFRINAQLRIPEENYKFASYQLEFKSKSGEMHFSYPPGRGTKNVVTTLNLSHLRWRQYLFQEPWVGITFDRSGINGKFGAKSYKGYVSGGFSFSFGNKSPWTAWVEGQKVDLSRLTKVISPENFIMTGELSLALQVHAHGPSIDRLKGTLRVNAPGGKLHVGKIESLLKDLPAEWSALKRSATTIALETLKDFEYDKAWGNFSFVNSEGTFNLDLLGPVGSRKLKFVVHNIPSASSSSAASSTAVVQ